MKEREASVCFFGIFIFRSPPHSLFFFLRLPPPERESSPSKFVKLPERSATAPLQQHITEHGAKGKSKEKNRTRREISQLTLRQRKKKRRASPQHPPAARPCLRLRSLEPR